MTFVATAINETHETIVAPTTITENKKVFLAPAAVHETRNIFILISRISEIPKNSNCALNGGSVHNCTCYLTSITETQDIKNRQFSHE